MTFSPSTNHRKPVVGVMGGSKATARGCQIAYDLGRLIAGKGWILLNGGRNVGVIAASSKGARDAGGMVVGILPESHKSKASPDLDLAVVTGMGEVRNLINVLSSDVIIACRGGLGTLSEVVWALTYERRVILLDFPLNDSPFEKYIRNGQLTLVETPEEAVEQATAVVQGRTA